MPLVIKIFRIFLSIIITILALSYIQSEIYIFPKTKVFSGKNFYNPYDSNRVGYKANFHAHAKSWGGLTNGKQSGDSVVQKYLANGFKVASLADYHKINPAIYHAGNIPVPVYEHGMNLQKAHRLAIGASSVSYQDVFLFQNLHTRQFLINGVAKTSELVCLAHPGIRNGHTPEDFKKLTNYQLIELANGSKFATPHWDSALSAGKAIWAIGNDDIHSIHEPKFGKTWTSVLAEQPKSNDVVKALKKGSSYVVFEKENNSKKKISGEPIPTRILVKDEIITISFNQSANQVRLIGQAGKVLESRENIKDLTYHITRSDTYIRLEIENENYKVFTNPIYRFENSPDENVTYAQIDLPQTALFRFMVIMIWLICTARILDIKFKLSPRKMPTLARPNS
jgi:hypothetical protein